MILFYKKENAIIYVVDLKNPLTSADLEKLTWLFAGAAKVEDTFLPGYYRGPRKEMITPWSTNAVEITRNMGIPGIIRIEEFYKIPGKEYPYDPMLQKVYENINQEIFTINSKPQPILYIDKIAEYNLQEGLALSADEIEYLEQVSKKLGRKLTDSEVFGFSQVNSEHCRHKIFNGRFIIDDIEQEASLFELIKKTTRENPNNVVSAYQDNVAFLLGPEIEQFAPANQEIPDFFIISDINTCLSLKAETHNFPTTVEPFNGAATGAGGEIRDRMAGGRASIPLAGTAVYMTSYPRLDKNRSWEKSITPRPWLYQSPVDILIKASNGASDFGNKFGQPLICGSLLTFEHLENGKFLGYDKVIMLAGGIGYAKAADSLKAEPEPGDKIVLLGGDNYRIGMGGGAVSSVATGEYNSQLELNAVQRANPEMQKRIYNTIRAFAEAKENPIVSNHDHGAGGHLNCLSELVTGVGGEIDMKAIPIGDPTLSDKEIIGNESQERMGLVVKEQDIVSMQNVADRERAPMYVIGIVTGDKNFSFINRDGKKPIDMQLEYMFGNPPRTVLTDTNLQVQYLEPEYETSKIPSYIKEVLQLEAVACKDWLTNKVDRSVTGKVAKQQTSGLLQLPLNNLGVMAMDYTGTSGIATSIGHAPVAGLVDSAHGSVLAAAEALTNIIWAPLNHSLEGVSLSANWMWPCKNSGEDARLYKAVKALSDFAINLGINIPTGKDSLSMTQKYPDGNVVYSPGTVIISAVSAVNDIKKIVEPSVKPIKDSVIFYIDFSRDTLKLGGSSFFQVFNKIGNSSPTVTDPSYFKRAFNTVQLLVIDKLLSAGHDISAGGLITTLLEMNFSHPDTGMELDFNCFTETDLIKILFSENPGIIIQVSKENKLITQKHLARNGIEFLELGKVCNQRHLKIQFNNTNLEVDIDAMRAVWYKTSYLLDINQSGATLALKRYDNYYKQPLKITFPASFTGKAHTYQAELNRRKKSGIQAAIIREKGINGDRELAYSLHMAGFDVKDVHMTDLITGRETLDKISFIAFPGGFSNSDVLGSAKGWAGAFLYNAKAKTALEKFYKRQDTLSLGVCNGCQLEIALDLLYPSHPEKPTMLFNDSHKFESAFLAVKVLENKSVMLHTLAGAELGIWVAHGEGKFKLPYKENSYHIPIKYLYPEYPGNPNGSDYTAAALCSDDGRHLAIMPHLERAVFPWQWGYYPQDRYNDEITPWFEAFVNAREWIKTRY